MAPLVNGASKAASARTSRAGSTARDIIKHRDKPYKTEQHRILAKKRKLNLRTTYTQHMPSGYTFLPVGTPDLAERCKEISRKKDVPVNVVNAKPVSRNAQNPSHVSHHIARIGYHFRADIVDEAREQLGYVLYRGKFVKETDLQIERQQAAQDSAVARAFERQGVSADHIRQKSQGETPDKVRAAIKELFPKIPDFDLDEIVRRAWEEGASRVGTNSQLGLPRRVQLATIARIRHTYTDYDQLLRAFEWKEARVMVEPGCLQKLIEWRGEEEDQDDDELEEIVRETIVIDDDDAFEGGLSDAFSSPIEIDSGSEAGVEIIHHAAAQDLGAESADDRSRRRVRRNQPRQREQDPRHALAKQKIGDARERLRTGVPLREAMPPLREAAWAAGDGSEPGRINVQPDANGQYPTEIIVDGQRMRLVSWSSDLSRAESSRFDERNDILGSAVRSADVSQVPSQTTQAVTRPQQVYAQPPPSQQGAYDHTYGRYVGASAAYPRPSLLPSWEYPAQDGVDRPASSIEGDHRSMQPGNRQVLSTVAFPSTPDSGRGQKRREDDLHHLTPPVRFDQPPIQLRSDCADQPSSAGVATVELLSPIRPARGTRTSPMVLSDGTGLEAVHSAYPYQRDVIYTRPPAQPPSYLSRPPSPSYGRPAEPQRLSYFADYTGDRRLRYGPGPEPPQYLQNQPTAIPYDDYTRAPPNSRLYDSDLPAGYARVPYALVTAAQPEAMNASYQRPAQRVPQPVHGAPAPIQQAYTGFSPRAPPPPGYKYADYGTAPDHVVAPNGERASARYQPLHGAIAPTQYYHPS
ncbi:hypothetical protein LTR29_014052 [Friedmanniomyces endolithicus]|nr:hypothetical protein LTR29_014052 [Friedmanniomyces endolithicus]